MGSESNTFQELLHPQSDLPKMEGRSNDQRKIEKVDEKGVVVDCLFPFER